MDVGPMKNRGTLGRSFTRKTLAPAKGCDEGARRKIAVSFDPPVFDMISKMAWANGIGFQEQVRRLCADALGK